ncbi:MAG: FAD-dependent oxidoreductase [Moraxellaceae bacterium]|nr:FAD-dependent oxidoreductase [Pseudobdellovibrionaceae bacterium]
MKKYSKYLILAAAAVLFFIFFKLEIGSYLTLDYVKSQSDQFKAYYNLQPAFTITVFIAVYIVVVALSLPGATILTLASGALFGVVIGTAVASVASTIGATCAFLVSRLFLRDFVQKKFASNLRQINEGFKKEGAFYLFTLRLIPAVPFFVINLVMGILPIRVLTFFFVSQIGMLAGTFVYVNAGTALSKITSLSGIISPEILGSFVLLGLFPFLVKKIVSTIQSRKYLKRYKKPKSFDYNMVVIGGGSAGLVTSYIAAAAQSKVALIEKNRMGGDCLNTGCIPSKSLIRSAKFLSDVKNSATLGVRSTSVEFNFSDVMERIQKIIKTIEPHDSMERYRSLGVECISGSAKIISPYQVEVNGRILVTKNIVIATGAGPLVPNIPGLKEMIPLTSDNLWSLREKPEKLLILGGGPIGCELAQALQRLGCNVTLVEKSPRILLREDVEVSKLVQDKMEQDGVQILTNHEALKFSQNNNRKICTVKNETSEVELEFDQVLVALGRKAHTHGFGAEALDIKLNKNGTITTNEFLATNYPNIFVCGDATGPYQFTHMAAHQAWYAAVNAMLRPFYSFRVDYRVIPWCTYTAPEVARVGLNEQEAIEQNIPFEVTTFDMKGQDRALTEEAGYGLVKVLTVPGKDKILGATIVGIHAGDIIAEYVLAMKYNLGLNKILGTIHIYPTLAEANKSAAGNWRKNHVSPSALKWAKRFNHWRLK